MPTEPQHPATEPTTAGDQGVTRRQLLRWSAGALGALTVGPGLLTACGGSSSGVSSAAGGGGSRKHVSMWLMKYYVPEANTVIEQAAKEAADKGGFTIDIQWLPFENSSYAKWSAAVEAKQLPDIGMPVGYPAQYWAMGKVIDVSDLFDEIGRDGGGWFDYVKDDPTINGKQWWIPLFNETAFGYYRSDVFASKGFQAPIGDLDQLLQAAKEVTNPAKKMWGMGLAMSHGDWAHNLPPVLWAFGASLQDKNGKIVSDSPEFVDAITWYTDLYLKYKVVPPGAPSWTPASNNQDYAAGQLAFCSNTGSILGSIRKDQPDIVKNTALGPWGKRGSNGPYAVTNLPAVFITKDSKVQDEAKAVIKSIMSPKYYKQFLVAASSNFLPVLKGYLDMPFFTQDKLNSQIVNDILPAARTRWWPYKATPTFSEVDSQTLWGKMLQQITTQGMSPKQAVDEFTKAAQQINDKYQKLYPNLYG